jgi:phthiocerol/phenolphthiocerol synthesis type-I polyketide synthase E
MIGHSIGEYVAACLSGVMSLEESLALVAERGRLMQSLPAGAMLAVPLSESDVQRWLDEEISLATVNAPTSCVLSGRIEAIVELERKLSEQGIKSRRLATSHAFHSTMMEPILTPFVERVKGFALKRPQVPFISNVSGTWIEPAEATTANYWAGHLRRTVRFADGVTELCKDRNRIFLEVGFGRTLCGLVKQQLPEDWTNAAVLASLRPSQETGADVSQMLETLGELWLAGAPVDWAGLYRGEQRNRVPLPTYPFERKRHWLEPSQNRVRIIGHRREQDEAVVESSETFHNSSEYEEQDVSALERVMSAQLVLMAQQLELLN